MNVCDSSGSPAELIELRTVIPFDSLMDLLCDEGDYICQEQDLNAMSGPTRQQENERSVGLGTQVTS